MVSYLAPVRNRVFLDTNIVWNWHTYGEEISDNLDFNAQEVTAKIGKKGLKDLEGFRGINEIASRYGSIDFVTSLNTIEELNRRTHNQKGIERLDWGKELLTWWIEQVTINYPDEDFSDSSKRAQTWLDYGVFDFLPDSGDRLLIASAMAAHCGIFLTMDYKTILPHWHRIGELTRMRVLRPAEFWDYVSRHI